MNDSINLGVFRKSLKPENSLNPEVLNLKGNEVQVSKLIISKFGVLWFESCSSGQLFNANDPCVSKRLSSS